MRNIPHFLSVLALVFMSEAHTAQPHLNQKGLSLSFNVGSSWINRVSNQYLLISPYVSDALVNSKQKSNLSLSASIKKSRDVHFGPISQMDVGPSIYYQSLRVNGDVWEMLSPQFFNYQYKFTSSNLNLLFESDLYFKSWSSKWRPFISGGIGYAALIAQYKDKALPQIPPDTELKWNKTKFKPIIELGLGTNLQLNSNWSIGLRYAYLYTNEMKVQIRNYSPMHFNVCSHNLLLGINYQV